MTRCRICCCTDTSACPGGCSWAEPDLCDVCADVTPAELAAAREVAMRVQDKGPSFAREPTRYAHAIAGAVRRIAAAPKPRKRKRGQG